MEEAQYVAMRAIKRFGRAEEIANAVAWLCSHVVQVARAHQLEDVVARHIPKGLVENLNLNGTCVPCGLNRIPQAS